VTEHLATFGLLSFAIFIAYSARAYVLRLREDGYRERMYRPDGHRDMTPQDEARIHRAYVEMQREAGIIP
jgi:hypothetical protein